MDDGSDSMKRLHEKFERLFSDFRRRFFNENGLMKNFAMERPHDHDAFDNLGRRLESNFVDVRLKDPP